jgi:outer membrane protein assembly factor BamE (lipoprotein component of BamABCDE complex)
MLKRSLLAAALLSALTLSGCVVVKESSYDGSNEKYEGQQSEQRNRSSIAALPPSLSVSEALSRLGTPDFNDSWESEQHRYQVLYYRTHRKHADGMTTRDECTAIVFIDDTLAGTGEMALDRIPKNG